jgi:N-acetylglucosamine-6-phosphate deacetylase
MIVLQGGDLVLPTRVIPAGAIVIDGERISAIDTRSRVAPSGARTVDARGTYVVPGFIDVHVHGVEGVDTLDGGDAIPSIAARLPRYGVTAFCPTTVACDPSTLAGVLRQIAHARVAPPSGSARVLPGHLESNFINPDYKGAQPAICLRLPPRDTDTVSGVNSGDQFSATDILSAIAAARPDVGIVTLAPELPGSLELIRSLVAAGHRVALGHSAADFDTAIAAIEAGARHATHLFNRMPPVSHRAPGLAGAVLARADIAAELICDGVHVHPAMGQMAIAAKGIDRVMAITDGTSCSGLANGAAGRLGGRAIQVRDNVAVLKDGTLAGSTLTMDRAFRNLITRFQQTVIDAATLCATTPARELGLTGFGVIAEGAIADLVVLDRTFKVMHTLIGGQFVFSATV